MQLQIIEDTSNQLLLGIEKLIEQTGRNVAVFLNTEISRLYWSIGNYVITGMQYETYSQHGQQILATLSQTLTAKFGKGYTYSGLNRMVKVAQAYDEAMFATLSRTLSWRGVFDCVEGCAVQIVVFVVFGIPPCGRNDDSLCVWSERGNRRLRRRFPLLSLFQRTVIPNGVKRNEESLKRQFERRSPRRSQPLARRRQMHLRLFERFYQYISILIDAMYRIQWY